MNEGSVSCSNPMTPPLIIDPAPVPETFSASPQCGNASLSSSTEERAGVRSRTGVQNDARLGMWSSPAVIAPNNFIYKSLSNWAFNIAVGCSHACRFCYVPSVATIKQGPKLAEYAVKDPDAEWGNYVLLRPWDEQKFLASLRSA